MENIVVTWLYLLFDHGQSLSEIHRILSPLHGTVICKNLKVFLLEPTFLLEQSAAVCLVNFD